ncbi:MAG TPA: tetratricopeptide repeat protein [Bacteroidia bacterium]|nr:tetratricopeptide repeat protein [Bacteroidia bacterium]
MKIKYHIFIFIFLLIAKSYGQKDIKFLEAYNLQISDLIDNGNYELAQKKADSLFILSKQINYTEGIAESYNLKGIINRDQSNLKDALDNYLNALKLFEDLKMPVKVAGIQNNIGLIYAEIKEYRTALAYYFKAEKINIAKHEKSLLAINYNNMATCYQKLNQFSSAQTYLQKSLILRQEVSDTIGMAMAYHNIGINHQLTNDNDSAIYFFNKSLSYLSNMSENIGHAYNYLELGNTLLQKGKLREAEGYLLSSLRISERSELEGVKVEVYKYLSELYEKQNDFKKAFNYQNLYLGSKENVESDESKNEILKKELEYDFAKRQELQRKDAENKQAIADAEIRSQKKLTTGAVIALLILSGLIVIVFRSYNQKRKANAIISKQKELVEQKNKEILDSINYAKYIQNALLPSDSFIKQLPVNCFILFKPKDIVSGDFYWIHHSVKENQNIEEIYIAAVDCTGHGVPGALVSVVGNNGLNRCVKEFGINQTGEILDKLSELVEETFEKSENELKDGMDISLLKISSYQLSDTTEKSYSFQWSGANNPLWIIRKDADILEEIKADKQPVGKFSDRKKFTSHNVTLKKGDRLYLFTDGYADQFGGEKGKKFKYKQLEELLLASSIKSSQEQKEMLDTTFLKWKGNLEQVDDICIIGITI